MNSHSKNNLNNIEALIISIRDQNVILDSDVAAIYGVETKRINEAVSRNRDKFPPGYVFELNKEEWKNAKEQNLTPSNPNIGQQLKSQIATSKGGKTKPPKAFTEKGLYMLATILKSERATEATLQIIETFAKVREFSRVAKSLANEKDSGKQKELIHKSGELIGDILNREFADDVTTETTIELNLAMIKVKHSIRKGKK